MTTEDWEYNVAFRGVDSLGNYNRMILKSVDGHKQLVKQVTTLNSVGLTEENIMKAQQKIMLGKASTMKMLIRNQKAVIISTRTQAAEYKKNAKEMGRNTAEGQKMTAQLKAYRSVVRTLPIRKLGSDLKSLSVHMASAAKNAQWVGRQMMVSFGLPIVMVMRRAVQQFYSFEKALVRTQKILAKTEEEMVETKEAIKGISEELGAAKSIVAAITADFAQMGTALLRSANEAQNLEKAALEFTKLTFELEKVGQVSADVGRDFIANLAGITKSLDPFGNRINIVSGLLAKFNMLENTTALSMADLAEAFPQVSPAAVAAGIELTFLAGLLGRMKEMGLNATESAHALKFSIQRLVNPTTQSTKAAKKYSDLLGGDFHENLGMGNEMLFNLAENMQLIRDEASHKEALVYLGDLVGKRQASRLFALVMGMDGVTDSINSMSRAFGKMEAKGDVLDDILNMEDIKGTDIAGSIMGNLTAGLRKSEDLADVKAVVKEAFSSEDNIAMMQREIIAFDKSLGDMSAGLNDNSSMAAIWNVGLSKMGPELKALVIDYMGATNAGKMFTDELEIVMGGPAAQIDKMKQVVRNLMEEFGAAFYDTFQELIPRIKDFVKSISDMAPATKRAIIIIVGALVALGPAILIVSQLKLVFSSLLGGISMFLPKMKAYNHTMMVSDMMQNKSIQNMIQINGVWYQQSGAVDLNTAKLKKNSVARKNNLLALNKTGPWMGKTVSGLRKEAQTRIAVSKAMKKQIAARKLLALGALPSPVPMKQLMPGPAPMKQLTTGHNKFYPLISDQAMAASRPSPKGAGLWKRHFVKVVAMGKVANTKLVAGSAWAARTSSNAFTVAAAYSAAAAKVAHAKAAKGVAVAWKLAGMAMKKAMAFSVILVVLAVIVGMVMLIKNNLAKVGDALKPGMEILRNLGSKIMAFFKKVGEIVFTVMGQVFGGAKGEGQGGAAGIEVIGNAFETVMLVVDKFMNVVMNALLKVLPPILKGFMQAVKFALGWVGKIINWVKGVINDFGGTAISIVIWVVKAMEFFRDAQMAVGIFIMKIIRELVGAFFWLGEKIGWIIDRIIIFLGDWLNFQIYIAQKIVNVWIDLVRSILENIEWIVDKVAGLLRFMGMDIETPDMTGWIDGVQDGFNALADGAIEFIDEWADKIAVSQDLIKSTGKVVDAVIGGIINVTQKIKDVNVSAWFEDLLNRMRGSDLTSGVAEAISDGIEKGAREYDDLDQGAASDIGDAVEEAVGEGMQNAINEFIDKVKEALKKELDNIAEAALSAFDAYTEIALSAYDARIEAINEVKKAEKELTKTLDYESKRREMINQMAVDRENYIRNRHLAIYEGRIEDARNLSVQYKINAEKADDSLGDLDDKREQYLINKERDMAIEAIKVAKELEQERLKILREGLEEQIEVLKEKLPATVEEWTAWMNDLTTITDSAFDSAFGDSGVLTSSLEGVSQTIGMAVNDWKEIVSGFDAGEAFQAIFDDVNEKWKQGLEWEIIAQSWIPAHMDATIPLLLEMVEAIKSTAEEAMGSAIDDMKDLLDESHVISSINNPSYWGANAQGDGSIKGAPTLSKRGNYYSGGGGGTSGSSGGGIWSDSVRAAKEMGLLAVNIITNAYDDKYVSKPQGHFFGGAIRAQYGRYLGGFRSSAMPVIAHGGEYIMNAKAVQSIGLSNLNEMNRTGRDYSSGGASGVTINVDNFIGQPEWFEEMMSEYDVKVTPRENRNAGTDVRKISSMSDSSNRRRV